jgi:hypothetical protein
MVRAFVVFDEAPEPERYRQHVEEFAAKVPCDAFRQGRIFGSPFGEPRFRHYAEFEWSDMQSFKAVVNGDELAAAGADAMAMGVPFLVHFAEITQE